MWKENNSHRNSGKIIFFHFYGSNIIQISLKKKDQKAKHAQFLLERDALQVGGKIRLI